MTLELQQGGNGTGVGGDHSEIRRLYKICVESVKKLDQSTKDKKVVTALYHPDVISARIKLRDASEKLMFLNPLDFGRKAEDLIWKKCFYDPIQLFRHNRVHLREEDVCQCCLVLASGLGFYHGLLIRLRQNYRLGDLHAVVAVCDHPSSKETASEMTEWAKAAAFKTLIYMGDLARYQVEFDGEEAISSSQLSAYYYLQALILKPQHGMPHNQLGTLYRNLNYGSDAVYYYLRCIVSEEPFDGAQGNLLQILKNNQSTYDAITQPTNSDVEPSADQ